MRKRVNFSGGGATPSERSEVGVCDDNPRVLEIFGQVKGPTRLERGHFRSGELVSNSGGGGARVRVRKPNAPEAGRLR